MTGSSDAPYTSLSDSIFDKELTLRDAFHVMVKFIEQYHARGESPTGNLLADLSVESDNCTLDPA